uniref:Uncharacterized protein n=1 Tax=viral metagenome TaxID=1070528 RepID=A0A6C0AHP9_9ZZZZ
MLRVSDTFVKTVKGNQNRVKRTGGFSRKELGSRATKYSDSKIKKRRKNVELHRASRSKNVFDSRILRVELVWPYENGMPKNLEIECQKPLGPGW